MRGIPGKLRAKKQAAQAAIEAGAEREFQARYDDQQHWMLAGMSEYYGSEGFDRPPSDVYSSFGGFVFVRRGRLLRGWLRGWLL